MPIENNPDIDDESSDEEQIIYKKKPIIKKVVGRKPKVNKDIDELKKSIKILENIALTKSSPKVVDQRHSLAERAQPKVTPPEVTESCKKKSRKIKQIIYESSDDERAPKAPASCKEPEVSYTQPKVHPKSIAPKQRRRFIFKK